MKWKSNCFLFDSTTGFKSIWSVWTYFSHDYIWSCEEWSTSSIGINRVRNIQVLPIKCTWLNDHQKVLPPIKAVVLAVCWSKATKCEFQNFTAQTLNFSLSTLVLKKSPNSMESIIKGTNNFGTKFKWKSVIKSFNSWQTQYFQQI